MVILWIVVSILASYGLLMLIYQIWQHFRVRYILRNSQIRKVGQQIAIHNYEKNLKDLDEKEMKKCIDYSVMSIAAADVMNLDLDETIKVAVLKLRDDDKNVED